MIVPIKLNGEYYTTAEAAKALSVNESRVRQLVRANKLMVVPVSPRAQLIPASEIRRFLSENGKTHVAS